MTPMMWLVITLLIAALELLSGNFFMLLLAAAAGLVAIAAWLGLDSLSLQILLFGALSAGITLVWYRRRPKALTPEAPRVNVGRSRWVGREFVLPDGLVGGRARVALDDTTWSVTGPDLPPGTRVRVTWVDGTTLVVAPVEG